MTEAGRGLRLLLEAAPAAWAKRTLPTIRAFTAESR